MSRTFCIKEFTANAPIHMEISNLIKGLKIFKAYHFNYQFLLFYLPRRFDFPSNVSARELLRKWYIKYYSKCPYKLML